MLAPRRRRGFEHLDDAGTPPELRERSLRDVRRANTLLGGTHAVLAELSRVLPSLSDHATLLDVGSGLADIPARASRHARQRGVTLDTIGVDAAESLVHASRSAVDLAVCADVQRLPFADASVDVVTCSQVLHHFPDDAVPSVLRELQRVARRFVVVSDLRRSWVAALGFWVAAWPLGFHPITRHDGFTSVLRGFTPGELARHVRLATTRVPDVRRHPGYRITATWRSDR